jgi:polyhydroxyalkanoate synthesis regulator phasin
MSIEQEILAECRELRDEFQREIRAAHSEFDGLAAMLKHGFEDVAASKDDVARLEAEIAALKRLLESLEA